MVMTMVKMAFIVFNIPDTVQDVPPFVCVKEILATLTDKP